MRSAFIALCLLTPSALLAEDVVISSSVSDVTVFPDGASVHRQSSYDIPAGAHRLVLTDMPFVDPSSLRLSTSAASIGAVAYRDDFVPPRSDAETAAIEAAQTRIDAVKDQIAAVERRARDAELEADAAQARLDFLVQLGRSDSTGAADPARLRDLLDLVGTEGLAARKDAAEARDRAEAIRKEAEPLQDDLAMAQAALKAVQNENTQRSYLTIEVESDADVSGTLDLTYTSYDAGWQPAYDMSLTTTDAPALTVDRAAYVHQSTGENWTDVVLTLSTARPSGQVQPGDLWPDLRQITDEPVRPMPLARGLSSAKVTATAEGAMMMDAPAPITASTGTLNGVTFTYDYPRKVSVASAADALKLDLGTLDLTPQVFARAVPMLDPTAYLVASFTNDSGEMLLPTDAVQLFLDGTFVGRRSIDLLADGDEAEYAFGPIDGLRLERRVNDRIEGDRGIIARSNERREEVTITLDNLTARDWDVRLIDRVPYSEQEDLKIAWQADPMPEVTDVDGKRGILEWRFPLAAGASREVSLDHQITWPEGKFLN
ncbi:mucoidy inhibitor MuiA family protein [Pseudooceanicola sediminis]|uniref:Mucoidy inhibitor MuiA family protein n=1 Tax=Pseudooceanicola sediminis TaxID=2211117 RepID=A0A399IWF8_9RHOB|nr:DUF4139 domain-containing protein [Pseudooceanicola sediminis]KAA2312509.1 DUF4139 domain-containing protein [Puniceibacterium sp. HSS470]RII37518.1 mucoidy inhibitor MuiA family protein [Pseudooceanicola sediminis]|tara:strand:- start:47 stop:1681 length:1635 start_codon:yes stop_codon:yes gene_type:complete